MILITTVSCFFIGFLLGRLKYVELLRDSQREQSRRNHPSYNNESNFTFDTNFWIQKSEGNND